MNLLGEKKKMKMNKETIENIDRRFYAEQLYGKPVDVLLHETLKRYNKTYVCVHDILEVIEKATNKIYLEDNVRRDANIINALSELRIMIIDGLYETTLYSENPTDINPDVYQLHAINKH